MTNKEIAQQLGISAATLSLIINHKPGVSETKRQEVFTELKNRGYAHIIKQTNTIHDATRNIGFIIYKKDGAILDQYPFFLLLLEIFAQQIPQYGYHMVLHTIDERNNVSMQMLQNSDLAGGIIFATEMTEKDMEQFLTLPFPIVALDNEFITLNCDAVAINNRMGTFQVIKHLVEKNHKRIGYFKCKNEISSFQQRAYGYQNALAHYHIFLKQQDVIHTSFTVEGSFKDVDAYLKEKQKGEIPTAFICDDDTIASGAIRAFQAHGYCIPEDIAIIGFNNRPMCQEIAPALTSVDVQKNALVKESVQLLLKRIETPLEDKQNYAIKILTECQLVVRQSS